MRKLCGTTSGGTSVKGLVRGLRLVLLSVGMTPPDLFHASPSMGTVVLKANLEDGPVVLPFKTLKPWDHWVVALGCRSDRVCVQDSAEDELRWPTWAELAGLWEGPGGPRGHVFGVAL